MIRIFAFDALKPEEILNRDIRAEASVEEIGRASCRERV